MTAPTDDRARCVIDGRRNRQDGALTCSACLAALDALLDPRNGGTGHPTHYEPASVPVLFALLDPRPGRAGGGRGAPGFASTLPLSAPVVDLRARTGHLLDTWAEVVTAERKVTKPRPPRRPRDTDRIGPMTQYEHEQATMPDLIDGTVPVLAGFLRRHLDWTSRQAWIDELYGDLRDLRARLRTVTGDPPPRPIGRCPNLVDQVDGDGPEVCAAPLLVAPYSDAVRCPSCARTWERAEWLRLGLLIEPPPDETASHALAVRPGERGSSSYPPADRARSQWGMPREEDRPTRQALRRTTTAGGAP